MPQSRKTRNLEHIAGLVFNRPWAILPSDMEVVTAIVELYLDGQKPTVPEAREAAASRDYGASRTGEAPSAGPTVRVIALHGTIVNRADALDEVSGGVSPQKFTAQVREAADDPQVSEIILDVDSGGGSVNGTQEMYQAVQYAASQKTITAVANGNMCSAAYWAVCPASQIVATSTSVVGSIGIIAAWRDSSKMHQQLGVQPYYYRSGPKKALGGPGEPKSKLLDQTLQALIDQTFEVFLEDVAQARGLNVDQVRERWGSGDTWVGQAAVAVGLADRIGTLKDEIDRAVAGLSPPGERAATSPQSNTYAQVKSLGVSSAADAAKEASMKIRLQAADGTFHEFEAGDSTAINAFLQAQYQASAGAVVMQAYSALGVAVPAGEPSQVLDVAALRSLKAQADDGAAYRKALLDQIAALTITTQGNDEAGQQAAERQRRVWATATIDDLKAEVERLSAVRDGLYPNAQVSSSADQPQKARLVRPAYARR